jgi:hypothetical protein
MKSLSALIATLLAVTLGGCESGPDTTAKTEAVTAVPDAQAPLPNTKASTPGPAYSAGLAPEPRGPVAQSPAETRKALAATRDLMNETISYMDQKRFDLAEKNLQRLKAERDSLPEYLQVQVDRMDVLLKTGSTGEPQRSLKAAIIESRQGSQ